MCNLVEHVSLQIFQMVNPILHSYELVERTLRPKIVRACTPAAVLDRTAACPTFVGNFAQYPSTIYDCDDIIGVEGFGGLVIDVAIEVQQLHHAGCKVLVDRTKAVDDEAIV